MKAFSGLLAFLLVVFLLAASAFVAIAITTGQSMRFWEEATISPTVIADGEPVEETADKTVEINFVFCAKPDDGVALNADTCSPLSIRDDSKVYIQMASGDPITINGFRDVKTGFKIEMEAGDTVMAISIENNYFPTITFGESTLKLEKVSEPRTVYLPLS